MSYDIQITEAFDTIVTLALALGVENLKDREDAWVYQMDEQWTIAVNGKSHSLRVQPEHCMNASLNPFEAAAWYNGWLVGLITPSGGVIIGGGEPATEEGLLAALDRAIQRTKQEVSV